MRILSLSHVFPPAIDGGSRAVYQLSKHYQSLGHKLFFLSSNCLSTDDFIQKTKPYSSTAHRLPIYKLHHRLSKGPVFKLIPFLKALIKIIKFKPKLIIAGPLPTTIIFYSLLIKKITKAKILFLPAFHFTDPKFKQSLILSALNQVDFIWSLTNQEQKILKNLVKKPKIITAGAGIDKSLLIDPKKVKFPKHPNILYIGAFAAHKNIEKLIGTFISLSKTHPHLTLTLAGQKTLYYPNIQNKIKKNKNIKLILNFKNSQLLKLIDSCTCLCLPSKQESFGLVLIEAMARGKPVCVNPIPALSEMIQKTQAGLPLSQIDKLITNRTLAKKLGNNGLAYVKKHYTWDRIGENIWSKIYSSL